MIDLRTAIAQTPSFEKAVEATLAFWAVPGDRRTRAYKVEAADRARRGERALRTVAREAGTDRLAAVQDVVMAAASARQGDPHMADFRE